MAYDTYVEPGAQPGFHHPADEELTARGNGLTKLTNWIAALVSVGLVAGVGVWSYKLMMRDVTGIPVVRAMQGEMRKLPETPGGQLARNTGLAVNAVAADDGAMQADRLVLAPQPVVLTDEDVPMDRDAVAIVQQAIASARVLTEDNGADDTVIVEAAKVAEAAESGSVDDLVAALTAGAEPIELDPVEEDATVHLASVDADAVEQVLADAMQDMPGVKVSLRPQMRPEQPADMIAAAVAAVNSSAVRDLDPANLPTGTRLAQLGAYDTEDMARKQWSRFSDRFGDLMIGKARVIQQASSGGRSFYRLRAHGFEDLADARRFCSALVAEGGDCIPVVTR